MVEYDYDYDFVRCVVLCCDEVTRGEVENYIVMPNKCRSRTNKQRAPSDP